MTNAPYLLPAAPATVGDQKVHRLDDVRRPLLRLRPGRHGRRHREVRRPRPASPASRRTSCRPRATGQPPPRPPRTACSTTRSSRSRSRSERVIRSWSPSTRASTATPPPRASPSCVPRSTRPATSPPATPARSATAGRRGDRLPPRPQPERIGTTPLGEVVGYGQVAGPEPSACLHPGRTGHQGRRRVQRHLAVGHLPVRAQRGLRRRRPGLDDRPRHLRRLFVNVNGGAITLGHPVGVSGAHRGPHAALRAGPPRWRNRRGRPLRRRRPGRRHPPAHHHRLRRLTASTQAARVVQFREKSRPECVVAGASG